MEISRSNGERIPQIQLICPEAVRTNYKELLETASYPPCYRIIPSALPFHRPLMDVRLTDGKIRAKSDLIERTVKTLSRQLGRRFFITLARNFGFGLNGDAFETWAHQLPLPGGRQTSERPFPDRSHLLWTSRHSGIF